MERNEIFQGNLQFFIIAVSLNLLKKSFSRAIAYSGWTPIQLAVQEFDLDGYVVIDSSPVFRKGKDCWQEFLGDLERVLPRISGGFNSNLAFQGEFAEKAEIRREGYVFTFHISEYERPDFGRINAEGLVLIPKEENIKRVAYLTISPEEQS